MMQHQTVDSNLRNFVTYYKAFIWLVAKKDNLTYLGYPFVAGNISVPPSTYSNFQQFTKLMDDPNTIRDKETIEWVYEVVINAMKNEHHHELAKYILYRTRYKSFYRNTTSLSLLEKLHKIVRYNKKVFAKKLRDDNPTDWMPNT